MNENVKTECMCKLGYDKGALKKTIENNVFTIYGNLSKNNCIVMRYHGELIDNINFQNYENNLYITYYFDGEQENPHTLPLARCTKCIGENYCVVIELEEHNNIFFSFSLKRADFERNLLVSEPLNFKLEIKNDLLTDVLQRHGIEENAKLPVIQNQRELQLKRIINTIKEFFFSFFKSKRDA